MSNVLELPDRSSARARVAAEVRAQMGRADISQQRLAAATGIPQSTLHRRLKAREERDAFNIDELEKIAKALGVKITRFFITTDDEHGPDDGGSRLTESNRRPIHYKASKYRRSTKLYASDSQSFGNLKPVIGL